MGHMPINQSVDYKFVELPKRLDLSHRRSNYYYRSGATQRSFLCVVRSRGGPRVGPGTDWAAYFERAWLQERTKVGILLIVLERAFQLLTAIPNPFKSRSKLISVHCLRGPPELVVIRSCWRT